MSGLKPPRRKRRVYQQRDSPFPVPIESITKKPACSSRWFYYTGLLHENCVLVHQEGDVIFLYKMGFFGKGVLSKSKPEHGVYVSSYQGLYKKNLPPKERRFQQQRFQQVRKNRYERHLSWSKQFTRQSQNVTPETDDVNAELDVTERTGFTAETITRDFTSRIDVTARTDDVTARTDDVTARTDDVTARTDDVTARTDDVTARTDDVTARTDGVTAKTDDVTAKTDDCTAKTDDCTAKTDDCTAKTDDCTAKTDDVTAKTDDVTAKSDDVTAKTDDVTAKTDVATRNDVMLETDVTAEMDVTPETVSAKTDDVTTIRTDVTVVMDVTPETDVSETKDVTTETSDVINKTSDVTAGTDDNTVADVTAVNIMLVASDSIAQIDDICETTTTDIKTKYKDSAIGTECVSTEIHGTPFGNNTTPGTGGDIASGNYNVESAAESHKFVRNGAETMLDSKTGMNHATRTSNNVTVKNNNVTQQSLSVVNDVSKMTNVKTSAMKSDNQQLESDIAVNVEMNDGISREASSSSSESSDTERGRTEGEKQVRHLVRKVDGYPIYEYLSLKFEEAYFLSYGLGCLSVLDTNKKALDLTAMWQTFCSRQRNFVASYVAYHYFRSKGWVPRDGLKYGAHYVLYKHGPPFYHGSYSVIVQMVTEGLWDSPESSNRLTWPALSGMDRITETVAKEVMFCYVIRPSDLSDEDMLSPKCIQRFRVQEIIMCRWVSSKERDSKNQLAPVIS